MTTPDAPARDLLSEPTAQDAELARVLETCLTEIEAGRSVDLDRLMAEHPSIADRLQICLGALNLVQQATAGLRSDHLEAPAVVGRLGDFDILREVGRGGMGVVYEARQISLGRRVALKVLPFAATLDPRQLQRFWMEAQAAALLHHVHIVPVYSVGSERGVHYYAMQFIEGQTLGQVIADVRSQSSDSKAASNKPAKPGDGASPTLVGLTTERSAGSVGYFQAVARLGVQVAQALEHAHQLGVIHRDIKPGNLLVDAAGQAWITDFGLARLRSHPGITLTGDTVGTLRYMSPEQALAKPVLVDHRTDIYSLGATLYEALTLQPAYPGEDREQVLRHIALGEPLPPRRVNRAVPYELETIVLKAMAREPEHRYATARELADDLERFLEHRPIRATRPALRERVTKWAWRHQAILAAVMIVALLATVGLLALTLRLWQEQKQTSAALELVKKSEAEAQVQRERAEGNFRKMLDGLNRLLWELENPRWAKTPGFMEVHQELTRKGLQILKEFVDEGSGDPSVRFQAARAYERLANIHLLEKQWDEAAQAHLKAVLLFEGLIADHPENLDYVLLLGHMHTAMGNWDISLKHPRDAHEEYRRAIVAYRNALPLDRDGTIHNNLAFLLCDCQDAELRDPTQAIALAMHALELAPQKPAFWTTLGFAHYSAGDWGAARAALEKSLELHPGSNAQNWLLLAMTSWREGKQAEARAWYEKAAHWLENHPMTDELYHFRRDAAQMLGIRWPE